MRAAERLTDRITAWPENTLSLITLTMRSQAAPLGTQLDNLMNSFRRLRQQKAWKARVICGVAVAEITCHEVTREWHPHLHIIASAKYWPQADLSKAWQKATGGSPIVDIRRIGSKTHAIRYVTKYMTKTGDEGWLHLQELAMEYASALHGRHMFVPFGKDFPATAPPRPDQPRDWISVISLEDCMRAACRGDQLCNELLQGLDAGTLSAALIDELRDRLVVNAMYDST